MEALETRFPDPFENSDPKNSRVGFSGKLFRKGKKRKKLNDLDKYVIFCFMSLIVFTCVIVCIFIFTQEEPSTLVTCFFAAFGGEILACALIKKLKLDKQAKIQQGIDESFEE